MPFELPWSGWKNGAVHNLKYHQHLKHPEILEQDLKVFLGWLKTGPITAEMWLEFIGRMWKCGVDQTVQAAGNDDGDLAFVEKHGHRSGTGR